MSAKYNVCPDELKPSVLREARWLDWVKKVEKFAGIASLDGDERKDGYSLDTALANFNDGMPPTAYAAIVKAAVRVRAEIAAQPTITVCDFYTGRETRARVLRRTKARIVCVIDAVTETLNRKRDGSFANWNNHWWHYPEA
jgi:hypothetical protein